MIRAHLLLPLLLAACTAADPWRHFPPQSRPSPDFAVGQDAAEAALPAAPQPQAATPASHGKRRAVPAQLVRMPPPPAPPPAVSPPALPPASAASGPQPVIQCDALSCRTSEGRMQGGTGNVHLDANGRPCHAGGGWLQCF